MRDELKLKPCPACEAPATAGVSFANCSDNKCLLTGPLFDEGGAKWNALPRRTDAPAGMSDGELIARAIQELRFEVYRSSPRESGHSRMEDTDDPVLRAELDRRAAARKEATK